MKIIEVGLRWKLAHQILGSQRFTCRDCDTIYEARPNEYSQHLGNKVISAPGFLNHLWGIQWDVPSVVIECACPKCRLDNYSYVPTGQPTTRHYEQDNM